MSAFVCSLKCCSHHENEPSTSSTTSSAKINRPRAGDDDTDGLGERKRTRSSAVERRLLTESSGREVNSKNVNNYTKVSACTTTGTGTGKFEEGYVEVCAKPRAKKQGGSFIVEWSLNGEAKFHTDCWDQVLEMARKSGRGQSQSNAGKRDLENKKDVSICNAERTMIKEAAETAEYHDSPDKISEEARRIASMIECSEHCVAFTGAGISTSAGIGDYRGKNGKWTEEERTQKYGKEDDEPPIKKQRIEESTSESEDEDVDGILYDLMRPTYTHEALVKLMELGYLKYVISQNGDGLHLLSGIPQEKIAELHGNVFIEKCETCGERYERSYYVLDDVGSQYYEDLEDYGSSDVKKPKHAKKCNLCSLTHRTGRKCDKKKCKGYLMDTIINFNDNLEEEILDEATEHAKACDLMICLGTTLTVTPASNLVKKGKKPLRLVICNRQETDMDPICLKKNPRRQSNTPLGSRVFGDCDALMREVMRNILNTEELVKWEVGREKRLRVYDLKRQPPTQ